MLDYLLGAGLTLAAVFIRGRLRWQPMNNHVAARVAGQCIWETRTVSEWEYRKIDLNQHRPQYDELDLLNAAGADGWELVGITSNNFAYLKRELEELAPAPTAYAGSTAPLARDANAVATVRGEKGLKKSR
jgi:hypothetical protein